MKIKMLIPIALVLCLAFGLCACGNNTTDNKTTTAPATTTAATTTKAPTTAPATTAATTENDATDEFTEEDALQLVKDTYATEENYFYYVRGTEEIDGKTYFAVDLRKNLEYNTTYMGLTYFVNEDGSEILEGYYIGNEVILNEGEMETADFTEEDALDMVTSEHPITDSKHFYHVRGTEEINGETYYAVDLMKKLEVNVTYMSLTYFVKADGSEIIDGYYRGGEVGFNTGEKPTFEVDEETAVKIVNAAYDFEDDCFLTLRGIEEIDGVNYYAVDLRKSFEDHSSYLSTFFVNEDGTEIVKGYYEGGVAHLSE